MFQAAVSKFTDSVGAESHLIAVPDLDSASHCNPQNVVIKKNKNWFWQSPTYVPARSVSLHELLMEPSPFTKVKTETHTLLTYNKTHKFSVKGKVGAKLKLVLGVEAEGSDYVEIDAKFGEILKVELDRFELMRELETRKLNLDGEFLKQIRKHKRKVLCVVVGTAKLKQEGTLTLSTKMSGDESVDADKAIAHVGDISEDVSGTDETTKSFKIPAGTPLAYNVCELLVHPDGSMELMLDKDSKGGFETVGGGSTTMCTLGIGLGQGDVTDGTCYTDVSAKHKLDILRGLDTETRRELTIGILTMCTYPHDVDETLSLLKEAYKLAEKGETKSADAEEIRSRFISTQGCCQPVLEQAGFVFLDLDSNVHYPKDVSPKLEAMRYLFEALIELGEDSLIALGQLEEEYVKPMQNLLRTTIEGKEYCTTDIEVKELYSDQNSGRTLAGCLGFTVDPDSQQIRPSGGSLGKLHAAYIALFALWHEIQDIDSTKGHCTVS